MNELPAEITENGIHYTLNGDYYLPAISIPDGDTPIGRRLRLRFLMVFQLTAACSNAIV